MAAFSTPLWSRAPDITQDCNTPLALPSKVTLWSTVMPQVLVMYYQEL